MELAPPSGGSTQAAVNSVAMQVTPENVLQARAALLAEAESFMSFLFDKFQDGKQLVGLCGGDPISHQAQAAFTRKIRENAVVPARKYVRELRNGADQLAQVARAFGFTEQHIADSFKPGARGVDPR